nr:starch binding protein SusD [Bacteroidota bacterium]
MKTNIYSKFLGLAAVAVTAMGMASCEDFLDRPSEDNYNADNFYTNDAAVEASVGYLYNSPWYDFQRGFIKVGEVFSGNMYWGSSPYLNFSVNGTDVDLVNMSYSLWSEIAHTCVVYQSIEGSTASQSVKDQCMGECLTLKALAYFYLVRSFGDVPIIHDPSAAIAAGDYNSVQKVEKADVYEYIVMTLEKALELLPKRTLNTGHIDYYCAEALLSKVYLTRAGVSGSLNNSDLEMAAKLAKDVIDNSGRHLEPVYSDIFRGSHNTGEESLIAWRWTVGAQWTCQNTLQSDLIMENFGDQGDLWGGWGGPSTDLMRAFGVIDLKRDPENAGNDKNNPDFAVITSFLSPEARANADRDSRRQATMMLPGDVYSYFWRNKGGFDLLKFYYDKNYNSAATEEFQGPCGCQNVKHLYGNDADHIAEVGFSPARMAYAFHTHVLRLADVYLIFAEAKTLLGQGSDAAALAAFNAVRQRAIAGEPAATSLTFDMIWKERRLEFAGEGDRWYDFVRRSYYDADACLAEIKSQFRNNLWGCSVMYKNYFESGAWWEPTQTDVLGYNNDIPVPSNITKSVFTLPFPTEDVAQNPNVGSDAQAIHVDVRNTYSY